MFAGNNLYHTHGNENRQQTVISDVIVCTYYITGTSRMVRIIIYHGAGGSDTFPG